MQIDNYRALSRLNGRTKDMPYTKQSTRHVGNQD